ncbi:PAS domain S-box protein [Noviherbaspirillum sp. 1P10PC]|uniref:PAS domain S-box protein n=1 Tax=Noviherbaspirillum sp. 1P10PC TaxID=3132292 RepID=UPI0039A08FB6
MRTSHSATSSFARSLGDSPGALAILAHDWSATSLGPINAWPGHLRLAVSMLTRSPTPMALLWGEAGALLYNDGYARVLGDKHPGALGSRTADVWPEAADFNLNVLRSVQQGQSLSYRDISFLLERDGVQRRSWFDLDYSPVFDDDGNVAGTLAVVIEKTELVLMSQALEQEREQFVALFEQAPTFMAILRGPEHRIERMNPGYARLVGHRDVLGKTVAEALPEAREQGYLDLLDQVFSSGEAVAGTGVRYTLQSGPDGSVTERFLDFVYQPLKDAAGAVTSIFVEGVDVTDRETAAAAKKESDARNRQILDSAIDYAIVAFDLEGRVTRWNEGACRVLGWTESEMLGQEGSCFFTPEDRANGRLRTEMRCALAQGAGNDERWHVRKSGERFWASGEMTPIRDERGVPIGFVKVLRDRTEQHQAAHALRESRQRLEKAQAVGGVGTFTVDLASGMLLGTSGFHRIFGLPDHEQMPVAALEALVLQEDAAVPSAASMRRGQPVPMNAEYRIRRASDGALRWIAGKAEFEWDEAGRTSRLVGVVQDITDRKDAEQAVQESAAQFRLLAQAMPNHVWTAAPDGKLTWFNDQVYEYSGAAAGALDGDGWTATVHPEDRAAAAALWQQSVALGVPYETEYRILRADGQYLWHLVRASPLRGADGAVNLWIGANTDIHERKLLEAQNTRERNRIWSLSQELMLICDFQGVISAVNPATTRQLGWSEQEMIGRVLGDFLHPDDLASTAAEVGKLSTGVKTLAFENRYRHRNGGYLLLSWTAVPDGGMIHAVARDITRERSAEDALRQSQKLEAIGQLTGGVAHDFNNLLAIMRSSIDLLRLVQLTDERRRRYMTAISDAITRATKLTGQLLAFARRQALQPVVFDVRHNMEMVSEMVGSITGARIARDVRLDADDCLVHADPNQFDTAIVNLAVNARDAMDGSGRLALTVSRVSGIPAVRGNPPVAGEFVAVSIADTGVGIPPQFLTQIFEPFFTTKGTGQGTGLGLSQVFGFAKQSGGEILVESEVGAGTVFTLYLPRAVQPAQQPDMPDADSAIAKGPGGRILIVEDNPDVALSVERTVEELGYVPQVVASAEQALAELERDAARFAAVFSDVVMAGMNGIDLGKEVRRRYPALPFVLSSGYSYVLAMNPDHGFTLLPKPYALEELASTLEEAIAGASTPTRQAGPAAPEWHAPEQATKPELLRQAQLDAMQVLDSDEEEAYDELTRLAASFCDAPIALISLLDNDRQWFKSRVGTQLQQTPREHAFCAHAIQSPQQVMLVNDASVDARFADNPLVTGEPNIRFYAGAPLVTSDGHALGTLCVLDSQARSLQRGQLEMLQFLARQVVSRLEARRLARGAGGAGYGDVLT